jgi:hypothetical protein
VTSEKSPLKSYQQWFKNQIKVRARTLEPRDETSLEDFLCAPKTADSLEERFAAYADGYPARMIDGLKEAHEGIYYLLGDDRFSELSQQYMRQYPSRHYDLGQVGRHLPAFLKERPPAGAPRFLVDLAIYEQVFNEVFHCQRAQACDFSAINDLTAEQHERLRLLPSPSVRFFSSPWPVWEYESILCADGALPPVEADPDTLRHIVLGRVEDGVSWLELDNEAYRVLRALMQGSPLMTALSSAPEGAPVQEWFANWNACGVFSGFSC